MNKTKIIALSLLLSFCATSAFAKAKLSAEIAGTISDYKYEEPGVMNLKGMMYGVDARLNLKPEESKPLFLGLQLALSTGNVDYSSNETGSIDGEGNDKQELRFLVGVNQDIFSPYIGLGYRKLVNDSSDMVSTTGHGGYHRASQYYYMPIGLAVDVLSSNKLKVTTKLEYDYFIKGRQESDLTSFGYNPGIIKNNQKKGYGYRFSVQATTPIDKDKNLFIEPYYEYWNIDESSSMPSDKGEGIEYWVEPKNNTEEFGVKIGIGF